VSEKYHGLPPKEHCVLSALFDDIKTKGDCRRWVKAYCKQHGCSYSVLCHRYRQRQQRLKRHGHCGRFDRCYR